ncbi:MAG: response regulator [Polyangiaceae bacterium]
MVNVLVIEDEEVLRRSMTRGLSKVAGAQVLEAGSLESALETIDRVRPDIVVSDIDLPRRSGLELLGELGRRGINIPVIYVSGYLRAFQSQIPAHANVEVFEKPVALEDLRDIIVRKTRHSSTAAEVAPFSVADYLQLAAMGRHSVLVEVERSGRVIGEVAVWGGETWSANDDGGGGADALRRLAFAKNTFVRCRTLLEAPPHRDLTGNWEYLLLEAARIEDEESEIDIDFGEEATGVAAADHDAATPAEDQSSAEPAAVSLTDKAFAAAWDAGVDALLSKDYSAAMAAFVEAHKLRPEDSKVNANIQRLKTLGVEEPQDETQQREENET